jgi:membrane protein YdbS with pleckstrin-like domain
MLSETGERIRHEARRHEIVLLRPLGEALALAAPGAFLVASGWPFSLAGAFALAAGALRALVAVWCWDRTRVVVTTEKLFVVEGTLRRRAAAVRLTRIACVEIEQSSLGRLLGYGTIVAGELEVAFLAEPALVAGLLDR